MLKCWRKIIERQHDYCNNENWTQLQDGITTKDNTGKMKASLLTIKTKMKKINTDSDL